MAESVRPSPETKPSEALFENVIIQPSALVRTLWLVRRAFIVAYEDNCFGIAKAQRTPC